MKRSKDSGFTLIELMIVIAVIGILAIVLVPRVGTVKEQAKNSGLETNLKMVQGYVESRITHWDDNERSIGEIADDIDKAFSTTGNNQRIVNPHSTENDVTVHTSADGTETLVDTDAVHIYGETTPAATIDGAGTIAVLINSNLDTDGIVITALDVNGNVYSSVTVMP